MISVNDKPVEPEPDLTVRKLLDLGGYGAAMVAVWIDDDLVPRKEYCSRLVPDGSDVRIVLMIAGG